MTNAPLASRVTNVVFMGMGEPLANYREVLQALKARVGDDEPARAAASDAVRRGAARKKQAAGSRERGLPGGGILG